jgi:hypothetical protein
VRSNMKAALLLSVLMAFADCYRSALTSANPAESDGALTITMSGSSGASGAGGSTNSNGGSSSTAPTTSDRACDSDDGGGGAHTVAFAACCGCGWPLDGPLCSSLLQILPFESGANDEDYLRCMGGEVPACILDHLDSCADGYPPECNEVYVNQVACISQP